MPMFRLRTPATNFEIADLLDIRVEAGYGCGPKRLTAAFYYGEDIIGARQDEQTFSLRPNVPQAFLDAANTFADRIV